MPGGRGGGGGGTHTDKFGELGWGLQARHKLLEFITRLVEGTAFQGSLLNVLQKSLELLALTTFLHTTHPHSAHPACNPCPHPPCSLGWAPWDRCDNTLGKNVTRADQTTQIGYVK